LINLKTFTGRFKPVSEVRYLKSNKPVKLRIRYYVIYYNVFI